MCVAPFPADQGARVEPVAATKVPDTTWTPADIQSIAATTGTVFSLFIFVAGATYYPLVMATLVSLVFGAALLRMIPVAPMSIFEYVVPLGLISHALKTEGRPSPLQFLLTFIETFAIVGFCMSVCLHRYFAHAAFRTSRVGQACLAIMGCLAYQGGPLWWASKHRRHHKYCDKPEDPHSWVQTSYAYAWLGWMLNPAEQEYEREYIEALLRYPELRFISAFWWVWPLLAASAVCHTYGFYCMVIYATTPMLMARMVTLVFNVEYHPPHRNSHLDTHRPGATPADSASPPTVASAAQCMSIDMARFLADCVGESSHDDHHAHPSRAKRPSGGFPHIDMPYWLMIKPLLLLGVIWDPK
jgi:fatty-acid desaturase